MKKLRPGEFTETYLSRKAQQQYRFGEASFKIDPKKSALVIVDMLDEFTKPRQSPFWVPEATKQLPKIRALLEAARKSEVLIIYTCYVFQPPFTKMNPYFISAWAPLDKLDDYEGPDLFTKESIDEALKPNYGKDVIIEKVTYGAFTNTPLDYVLKNHGIDTVIICGTMTNYCCGTTAREAHARGYKVVFGSDVTSSDDNSLHEAELKTLRRAFALVLPQKEIIKAIQGTGKYAA